MNKQLIKAIALSKGWEDVEALLRKEFNDIKIDTKQGCLEIGKQYLAKDMAKEALEKSLRIIKVIAEDKEKKKKSKYI